MKNTLCRITGILALAFLATTQVALAQEAVLANIPFAFTAGKMALPAGEYRVDKLSSGSDSLLVVRRTHCCASTIVISNAVEVNKPQAQTKLIFRHISKRYFLSQVWVAGNSRGRELPPPAKEKERLLARNEAPDQVTIVASLIPSNH